MAIHEGLQLLFYFGLLIALIPILGNYMAKVLSDQTTWLSPVIGPLEKGIYRLTGIDPQASMSWKTYSGSLLLFNGLGILTVFGLQIGQSWLPLNPEHVQVNIWVALNTAVSFVTNTNWQAYAGEAEMSYLTQMLGLNTQNFLSAATGLCVFAALTRGLAAQQKKELGNFWRDLVRSVLYILLPLAIVLAVALVSQGVVQSMAPYETLTTLEGAQQIIPKGPAASQIAIKQLGTNGGGFFGVNSAHPLENPTPLSNFLQMLSLLLIPAALCWTYGKMVGSIKQGTVLLYVMFIVLFASLAVALWFEYQPNPALGITQNWEGKETRFGIMNSVLWANNTTAASNGSVNAMHDSFNPLSGMVLLLNILFGEVIFGGVGAGLYGMLMFVIITVFITGLMVGRTPEYLGKKLEAFEIRLAALAVVLPSAFILIFSAVAVLTPSGLAGISNAGPHGLSEILYAFSSQANNNGSAFGGLTASSPFYTLLGSIAMLAGRFGVILPALAIAGHMATKKSTPASAGTFPTDGFLFASVLIGVIVIVGALTFFPVLTLGPIAEHLLMLNGKVF